MKKDRLSEMLIIETMNMITMKQKQIVNYKNYVNEKQLS